MQRKEKRKGQVDPFCLDQRKAEKCSEWKNQWEGWGEKEQDEKLRTKKMLNNPKPWPTLRRKQLSWNTWYKNCIQIFYVFYIKKRAQVFAKLCKAATCRKVSNPPVPTQPCRRLGSIPSWHCSGVCSASRKDAQPHSRDKQSAHTQQGSQRTQGGECAAGPH